MRFPFSLVVLVAAFGCNNTETELQPSAPQGAVAITSPGPAAWLATGAVEVTGTATSMTDLSVNDDDAHLVGGNWSATVELERGVTLIDAKGLDARGDLRYDRLAVLAGTFKDPAGAVEEGLALRLNQGGLDAMVDGVAGDFDLAGLEDAAFGLNPVYEYSYELLGWEAATAEIDITGFSVDALSIDVDPQSGVLEAIVELEEVVVDLDAYGDVLGYDFDVDAAVWADLAEVVVEISVDAEDGALVADLEGASVELYEFGYDLSMIPDDVEPYLFVDTLRDQLEEMILEQVESTVPELIEEKLAELDPQFETELMGVMVEIDAAFSAAAIDNDGLALTLDMELDAPSTGTHSYAGYLSADAGVPSLSTTADLGFALSDDLLNRMLFEGWQAGVADQTLSTRDGSLDAAFATTLQAESIDIEIFAHLPPVVVERGGDLEVQVGELDVALSTPGGSLGDNVLVSVTAWVGIDPEVVDGRLGLDAGEIEFVVTVRDSDWGSSDETTTNLIAALLPFTLGDLIDSVGFDLPAFEGVSIETAGVDRDPGGVHTRAGLYLR